jgi:rRNA processing protein Gar1
MVIFASGRSRTSVNRFEPTFQCPARTSPGAPLEAVEAIAVVAEAVVAAALRLEAAAAAVFKDLTKGRQTKSWVSPYETMRVGVDVLWPEMGTFVHAVEGEMLCTSTNASKVRLLSLACPPTKDKRKVPYFNAPIYLENKSSIGKVDEILGPINEVYFTIKPSDGIVANSFKSGDKVYIGGDKLLPLDRFIPKPKILGPARASASGGLEWLLKWLCSTEEEVGAGSGCRRSRDGQRARCVLPLLHKKSSEAHTLRRRATRSFQRVLLLLCNPLGFI